MCVRHDVLIQTETRVDGKWIPQQETYFRSKKDAMLILNKRFMIKLTNSHFRKTSGIIYEDDMVRVHLI